MARKRSGVLRMVVGIALFAAGCAVFLYPTVSATLAQQRANKMIEEALAVSPSVHVSVSGGETTTETESVATTTTTTSTIDANTGKHTKEGDPAYEYLRAYNERVRRGEVGIANDPWGTGTDAQDLAQVGLSDVIIGGLTIRRLNETAPIYLDASDANLHQGVCVISGTSAPLGETDSNCVIAGHRSSVQGLTMFRDVEDFELGDQIIIETPWDAFAYQVVEKYTIDPDDAAAIADVIAVQPGRDLVTLFTCHPYGHNDRRFIVVCERVEGTVYLTQTSNETHVSMVEHELTNPLHVLTQVTLKSESPDLTAERWMRVVGLFEMVVAGSALAVIGLGTLARGVRQRFGKRR